MTDVSILEQGKSWSVLGYSQIGSSHLRKGQERQDAFDYRFTVSGCTLLAVSDGHGSKESPDSRKGAELAVDTALEYLDKFLRAAGNLVKDEFKELHEFSQREHDTLVAKWQERVMDDYRLRLENGESGLQAVGDSKYPILKRYGCTLIAAIITDRHAFFLQLGDGDVLLFDSRESGVKRPIKSDLEQVGNETWSLCQQGAWKYVQTALVEIEGRDNILVMLSTDGYANAFATDDDFLKVLGDYARELESHGIVATQKEMAGWLEAATHHGSGDDITALLVSRGYPFQSPLSVAGISQDIPTVAILGTRLNSGASGPQAGPNKSAVAETALLSTVVKPAVAMQKLQRPAGSGRIPIDVGKVTESEREGVWRRPLPTFFVVGMALVGIFVAVIAGYQLKGIVDSPVMTRPVVAPPEKAPPEKAPPEKAPPEKAPPEKATPEMTPPEMTPPEKAPSEMAPPEKAPPKKAPPKKAPPKKATPEKATPEKAPPEKAPPEKAPPEKAPPEKAPPEKAPPEKAPPEKAPPERAPPERAPPEKAPPEKAPPEKAPPEKAPPEKATPEKATPVATPFDG